MSRLKILFLSVCALVVVGAVAASSASAACPSPCLPTWLLLPGTPLPVDIHSLSDNPNNGILSHLANSSGTVLEGKGFSVLYSLTNLNDMSDSSYLALFLEVTEPKEKVKCNTTGDKTGEVLLPTALVLDVGLVGGGVGELQLVPEFSIKCGTLSIKVKGSALSPVKAGVGEEVAEGSNIIKGVLHCKNEATGEPELSKYLNEKALETLIPTLLANAGAGFLKSCEEILPTITLLPSQMVELMECP
jgi:hypothetical protein